jgi:hypothetical protein
VLAVAVVLLAACQSALAAASLTPLPRSDYRVSPVCPAPSPGRSSCLALALVPVTREALAHTHPLAVARTSPLKAPSPAAGNYGLRPQDIRSAYKLPSSPASPQTIAIVDAYNDPNAESDLKAYDQEFGLLECTAANGCLRLVNQYGETGHPPFPKTAAELEQAHLGTISEAETAETATGWGVELSLDMEAAHSTCQQCKIILVLANSEANSDLEAAERTAESLGANEITNSWGGLEEGESAELEASSPFNHPGTVITASAGDDGYLSWDSGEQGLAEFPASSPHVVAVGGTRLSLTTEGEWSSESVWNGDGATGGGCSVNFRAPAWQLSLADWSTVGCGEKRAVADVAAVADPYTGFAVHYTSPACEYVYQKTVEYWCTIGGTSLASPVIAGVFALAGGSGSIPYPARTLYENAVRKPSALHDVQSGSNGRCTLGFNEATGLSSCTLAEEGASCASKAICVAGAGYDGPTGVGTPDGIAAFKASSEGAGSEPEQPGSGEGTGHVGSVRRAGKRAAHDHAGRAQRSREDAGVGDDGDLRALADAPRGPRAEHRQAAHLTGRLRVRRQPSRARQDRTHPAGPVTQVDGMGRGRARRDGLRPGRAHEQAPGGRGSTSQRALQADRHAGRRNREIAAVPDRLSARAPLRRLPAALPGLRREPGMREARRSRPGADRSRAARQSCGRRRPRSRSGCGA